MECKKCGLPHGACGGHNRQKLPCKNGTKGMTVCRIHGGAAPQTIAAAERNQKIAAAKQTAAALIVAYEGQVSADPLASLLRMVQTAAWAERAYATLIERDLGDGVLVEVGSQISGYKEEAHPYLKLWNEERDRLAKWSKVALDAGVDAHQVKLAEHQADVSIAVILAVMMRLNLPPELMAQAPLIAAEEFERLQ